MSSEYFTKPGDTFYKIGERFNFPFKNLEKINNIKQVKLLEQQIICVPISQNESIRLYQHEIRENETLEDIMHTYQVSYEEIKYFNNLIQLILKENQKILIIMKEISPVSDEFEKD